jgi:hypothetical protein
MAIDPEATQEFTPFTDDEEDEQDALFEYPLDEIL